MKKILILTLCVLLSLTMLAACTPTGETDETTTDAPGTTTDGATTTVGDTTLGDTAETTTNVGDDTTDDTADTTDDTADTTDDTADTTDEEEILYTVEFYVDGELVGEGQFTEGYRLDGEDYPTLPTKPGYTYSWPAVVVGNEDMRVDANVEDNNDTPIQTFG